jgi:hypothetical protein
MIDNEGKDTWYDQHGYQQGWSEERFCVSERGFQTSGAHYLFFSPNYPSNGFEYYSTSIPNASREGY